METSSRYFKFKDKMKLFILFLLLKNIYNINNEIIIIINQTISEKIINDNFYNYVSEVVVNEKPGNINNYTNLLNKGINSITIKFNQYLPDCSNLFCGCSNILNIITSNFNTLSVTNMS